MTRYYYAAFNIRADLNNGNHGFLNTWEVVRFDTRQARDAFVQRESNRKAEAVTRKEAARIWASTYECVGEKVPRGGLFGADLYGDSYWHNA